MTNISVTLRNSSQSPWRKSRQEVSEPPRRMQTAELLELRAREGALRQENEDLARRHRAQAEEFEHRLLNSVQMIASLLSAQSRSASPEASAQLTIAVNRIIAFGHVHRRLHLLDHQKQVDVKHYLECLCEDLTNLLSRDSSADAIVVQATSCTIPTALGSPLGFIVSELITNSAKHGKGKIIVRFETPSPHRHLLSVADDGPGLPAGFKLDDSKGLGMKIIQALVQQIDGKLRIRNGDNGRGAHFVISFRSPAKAGNRAASVEAATR